MTWCDSSGSNAMVINGPSKSVDIFNEAEAETFKNISEEELKTLRDIILKMQFSDRTEREGKIK